MEISANRTGSRYSRSLDQCVRFFFFFLVRFFFSFSEVFDVVVESGTSVVPEAVEDEPASTVVLVCGVVSNSNRTAVPLAVKTHNSTYGDECQCERASERTRESGRATDVVPSRIVVFSV